MRKRYGESKVEICPFCGKQATTRNKQKVPTCTSHRDMLLEGLKCACGDYLDVMSGKYGPFFSCMHCGNINYKKGLDMNDYPLKSIEDL